MICWLSCLHIKHKNNIVNNSMSHFLYTTAPLEGTLSISMWIDDASFLVKIVHDALQIVFVSPCVVFSFYFAHIGMPMCQLLWRSQSLCSLSCTYRHNASTLHLFLQHRLHHQVFFRLTNSWNTIYLHCSTPHHVSNDVAARDISRVCWLTHVSVKVFVSSGAQLVSLNISWSSDLS